MELCPPFDGWYLDEDGIIHTPSRYRCTPSQIEASLWLFNFGHSIYGKRIMYADTPLVSPAERHSG